MPESPLNLGTWSRLEKLTDDLPTIPKTVRQGVPNYRSSPLFLCREEVRQVMDVDLVGSYQNMGSYTLRTSVKDMMAFESVSQSLHRVRQNGPTNDAQRRSHQFWRTSTHPSCQFTKHFLSVETARRTAGNDDSMAAISYGSGVNYADQLPSVDKLAIVEITCTGGLFFSAMPRLRRNGQS
jgi:hypothetical protein